QERPPDGCRSGIQGLRPPLSARLTCRDGASEFAASGNGSASEEKETGTVEKRHRLPPVISLFQCFYRPEKRLLSRGRRLGWKCAFVDRFRFAAFNLLAYALVRAASRLFSTLGRHQHASARVPGPKGTPHAKCVRHTSSPLLNCEGRV